MDKMMSYKAYHAAKGGKGMSYEDYAKMAKGKGMSCMGKAEYDACMSKAEEAEDMDEEEDEDEGGEDMEMSRKSEVSAHDLLKAINDYETVENALSVSGQSREAYLTERYRQGMISKSEQAELGAIWSGDRQGDTDTLSKSLSDRIEDADPDAAGLIDASDFLKSLVEQTNEALDDISARVERDGNSTRNFLAAQGQLLKSTAMVLAEQDRLIKSQQAVMEALGSRLGVLEAQPVIRKSRGADPRDVRVRGTDLGRGSQPGGNALSKSEVAQGFRALIEKAASAGDDMAMDRLTHATALYESTGSIQPNIAGAIRMELGLQ
jgi:hypothetical protein